MQRRAGTGCRHARDRSINSAPRASTPRGWPALLPLWLFVRPRHQPDYNAVGKASWYGSDHDGRLTANGERADSTNLFAAHPTLPLPSYVSVENLEGGQILTVRVNDRGPVAADRIIGLSSRAAELLGLLQAPDSKVHVRYLSPAPIAHVGRNH